MTPICLPPTADQRELLAPILDIARQNNHYEGIFCAIVRHYSSEHGSSVLELLTLHIPRAKLAKLVRLLSPECTKS
jgi:hypothetical protein